MVILVIQTYDQRSIVATKKVLYPLSTIHGEPRASMHSCSRKCARTYLRTYVYTRDNASPKLAPQPTPQRAAPQPCLSGREPDMLRSLIVFGELCTLLSPTVGRDVIQYSPEMLHYFFLIPYLPCSSVTIFDSRAVRF
jgi:hypothetical protein